MDKVKYGCRVTSPVKDDKTEIRFYADTLEELREYVRDNCFYFRFVPKEQDKARK